MIVEDSDRAKQIFLSAVAIPEVERASYVEQACAGDASLCREVKSLLAADAGTRGAFLATPVDAAPGKAAWEPRDLLGSDIGPYKLAEVLGEGGFGAVYLAAQEHPVRRQVALKVLQPGMGSRQVIARFDAEKQALALMNHPSVAKVFDAGSTPQGLPYFVMEHVPGSHITDFCDKRGLSVRDRLDLFVQVCEAVQHAHQKGIIHRDLKPANVLVMLQDGRPLPKIIDFGIAKAIGQRLTEDSISTTPGQLIGSPQYMSPEQAAMKDGEIDTRTDIYALGLLLYELLVGDQPFDFSRDVGLLEILRRIREVEPPRPSSRLERLTDTEIDIVARSRRSAPASLIRQIHGDLDWIVAKAIEKDRTRRYASASELAADISRHLKREPVLAGPPGAGYRVKKFLGRHKWPVAAGTALLLTLLGGLTISSWFYFLAEDRLGGVLRLSDIKRLAEYKAQADGLWPALPGSIPALEAWLGKARELNGRLGLHKKALEDLRRKALPYTKELRARDRKGHPDAAELENHKVYLVAKKKKLANYPKDQDSEIDRRTRANLARNIERVKALIPKLEVKANERLTWVFPDADDQWFHDTLSELVLRLEEFAGPDPSTGVLADVEGRLKFAKTVYKKSMDDYADDWTRAIASIADKTECPRYEGLKIKPQLGLVPLARDAVSGLWELAHLQTGTIPVRAQDGKLQITEETGLVFVLIPGGTFNMGARAPTDESPVGAPNVDADANPDQTPVHAVTLKPFFISKYEMNQAQWLRFLHKNPSRYHPELNFGGKVSTLLHPLETVSWDDCDRVLRRLGLSLPTEAQWEYAARGGTATVWWTGSEKESVRGAANVADKFLKDHGGVSDVLHDAWIDDGYIAHAPVDSFLPNPYGLHGVIGNVWEWCRDEHARYWDAKVAPGDGEHHTPGAAGNRVVRGGSYSEPASAARVANRYGWASNYTHVTLGVRPARGLEE